MSTRTTFRAVLVFALLLAGPLRGDPAPGCEPSDAPGCGGCLCEDCVCAMDPFCCTSGWDPLCALRCTDQCGGCGPGAPCGDGVCGPTEGCGSCPFDCGSCPAPCGDITVKGCCLGGNLAKCVNGALQINSCDGSCGWSLDTKSYICGGGGPDPSGVVPLLCPEPVVDEDVIVEWPEVCEGVTYVGCCKGATLFWCDGVGLQSLACGNNPSPLNSCGWIGGDEGHYDCGGQGGDPVGAWDLECDEELGEIVGPPPEDECTVGETIQNGCVGVSFSGCCTDEKDLVFCEGGKLLCALHCGQLPSPLNTCGWKQAGDTGFYDCGGAGIDPSGQDPITCPDWTPDEDVITTDTGTDVVGSWGCPGLPKGGCCDGGILHYCKDGEDLTFDCAQMSSDPVFGAYVYCGLEAATGAASCLKKVDPAPPLCVGLVEPPESDIVAPPDDVAVDGGLETFDGGAPDGTSADGLSPDGVGPEGDGADSGWTWPDQQADAVAVEDTVGGGGSKGCTTATGTAAPIFALLFALMIVLSLSRLRGDPRR